MFGYWFRRKSKLSTPEGSRAKSKFYDQWCDSLFLLEKAKKIIDKQDFEREKLDFSLQALE